VIAEWVAQHTFALNIASYILAAISLVFGAKVLGRFPSLQAPGGLYRFLLAAVPAWLFVATVSYLCDVLTQGFLTRSLEQALHYSLDPLVVAIANGLIIGGLFVAAVGWTPAIYLFMRLDFSALYGISPNDLVFPMSPPGHGRTDEKSPWQSSVGLIIWTLYF
jgi:hypothetical protein